MVRTRRGTHPGRLHHSVPRYRPGVWGDNLCRQSADLLSAERCTDTSQRRRVAWTHAVQTRASPPLPCGEAVHLSGAKAASPERHSHARTPRRSAWAAGCGTHRFLTGVLPHTNTYTQITDNVQNAISRSRSLALSHARAHTFAMGIECSVNAARAGAAGDSCGDYGGRTTAADATGPHATYECRRAGP